MNFIKKREDELETMRPRRFHVVRIEHLHDQRVLRDCGIWSGKALLQDFDDDGYSSLNGLSDTDKFLAVPVGESFVGSLVGWHNEPTFWFKAVRLPDTTPIPDTRGYFTRLLQAIFNVQYDPET